MSVYYDVVIFLGLKKSLKGFSIRDIGSWDRMVRWVLVLVIRRIVWWRQMMVREMEFGDVSYICHERGEAFRVVRRFSMNWRIAPRECFWVSVPSMENLWSVIMNKKILLKGSKMQVKRLRLRDYFLLLMVDCNKLNILRSSSKANSYMSTHSRVHQPHSGHSM